VHFHILKCEQIGQDEDLVTIETWKSGKPLVLIRRQTVDPPGGKWRYQNGNPYRFGEYAEDAIRAFWDQENDRYLTAPMHLEITRLNDANRKLKRVQEEFKKRQNEELTALIPNSKKEVKRLRKLALRLNRENNALREKAKTPDPTADLEKRLADLETKASQTQAPRHQARERRTYVISSWRTFIFGYLVAAVLAGLCLAGWRVLC